MRIFFFLTLLSSFAFSDNGPELTSLFSAANNPGSGILEMKTGEKSEKMILGKESGYYGLGMVFSGNGLPESYKSDFKDREVVQLAFGSLKADAQNKISQFAAATLVGPKLSLGKLLSFPFSISDEKKKKGNSENLGILLYSPPSTAKNLSDDEKLKITFFAADGYLNVLPIDAAKVFTAPSQNGEMKFTEQKVKVQFNASLGTPFSDTVGKLEGVLEIPIYTPSSKAAEKLAGDIASKSLNFQSRSTATKK